MNKPAEEYFKDMLNMVTPYLKQERSSLHFEGALNDGEWDIVVSYIAKKNGIRLYVPEMEALEEPFAALVGLYKDGGRGKTSKCTFSLSSQGEVSMELEYTDLVKSE